MWHLIGNYIQPIAFFFDELQTINHAAIIAERILFALNGFEFAGIQVTASICIVPSIFIIIKFIIVQILSSNYLEPALTYPGTIFNAIEVSPLLSILSINIYTASRTVRCRKGLLELALSVISSLSNDHSAALRHTDQKHTSYH